jgi:hypothetical protein
MIDNDFIWVIIAHKLDLAITLAMTLKSNPMMRMMLIRQLG